MRWEFLVLAEGRQIFGRRLKDLTLLTEPESALEKSLAPRVIIITLNITYDQIFITEKSQHYGNIFMKTFYNVVEAIICCAKEARALIVLDIE